ncbi:hypothetical protein QJV45_14165 [Listeria booriae]|uniref:hypothetical protein n=1 Tax=Listeria booriae TaxID=1552123 RepID=UPI00288068ED|nr:hypothetical protein [Listeria booriae]MDT0111624.1 hypothetical protein [Listeria booriae]
MNIRKRFWFVSFGLCLLLLSACDNSNAETDASKAQEVKHEVTSNAQNVKTLVKAIKQPNVRYKLYIDGGEGLVESVQTDYEDFNGKTYGYDDPNKGTSIDAFAIKNGLNAQQAGALSTLSEWGGDKDGNASYKVTSLYPDDFTRGGYPYHDGSDVDYSTLSNIKTTPSEDEKNYTKITADVTIHLHLIDGTKVSHTYQTEVTPGEGDTKIDEATKQKALYADVMNQPWPTAGGVYMDKTSGATYYGDFKK